MNVEKLKGQMVVNEFGEVIEWSEMIPDPLDSERVLIGRGDLILQLIIEMATNGNIRPIVEILNNIKERVPRSKLSETGFEVE